MVALSITKLEGLTLRNWHGCMLAQTSTSTPLPFVKEQGTNMLEIFRMLTKKAYAWNLVKCPVSHLGINMGCAGFAGEV